MTGAKVLLTVPGIPKVFYTDQVSSLGTLIAIVAVTLPLLLALSSPSLDSSFLASLEGFKPTRVIVLLILSTFQGLVSPRPSLNTDLGAIKI